MRSLVLGDFEFENDLVLRRVYEFVGGWMSYFVRVVRVDDMLGE